MNERLSRFRQSHKDAEAGIARLLTIFAQGVMDAEDPSLRERLVGVKFDATSLEQRSPTCKNVWGMASLRLRLIRSPLSEPCERQVQKRIPGSGRLTYGSSCERLA